MCINIQTKKNPKFQTSPLQPYLISYPCGKCPLCLRKRLSNWIFRLEKEQERSSNSSFITLTYDNDHLPNNLIEAKRSLQLFFKRLRKNNTDRTVNLRYICRSEYGEKTKRLHFHIIAFNFPDYSTVEKTWGNGFVTVSPLTSERIRYTFKYIGKNIGVGESKTFQLTSKGIGSNYLTPSILDYHNRQIENCYIIKKDGHTMSIPKYYKSKLYSEDFQSKVTIFQQERINVIQDTQIAKLANKFRCTKEKATQKFELSKLNSNFVTPKATKL